MHSQDAAHPFYLAGAHDELAQRDAGGDLERGDPEYVNVDADEAIPAVVHVLHRPDVPGDEPRRRSQRHEDVNLDCAGTLTGWQIIGSSGYQFTRIDLVRHNFKPQNGCDNGRHVMSSASPFALTVWGWGTEETSTFTKNVRYAYPAGASISPINDVVVTP